MEMPLPQPPELWDYSLDRLKVALIIKPKIREFLALRID